MLASSAAAARHYGVETCEEQADDGGERNGTVVAYQGLAYSLAARFAQRGEELEDLNQVAMVGLVKAVDRFDPERGVALTTFASATILGELKRHLRDRSWSVRLPRRVHDLHLKVQQSIDQLSQDLGRSPAIPEIAADLGATIEDVVEALDAGGLRRNAPLETPSPTGVDAPGSGPAWVIPTATWPRSTAG